MTAHITFVNNYNLIYDQLKFNFIKFLIFDQYASQTKLKTKLKFYQIMIIN